MNDSSLGDTALSRRDSWQQAAYLPSSARCPGQPPPHPPIPSTAPQRSTWQPSPPKDEIAKVALFLASDDSSFVTGIELFVNGGKAQV